MSQQRVGQRRVSQRRMNQRRVNQHRVSQLRVNQRRVNQRRVNQNRVNQRRVNLRRVNQRRVNQHRVNQHRVNQRRVNQQLLLAKIYLIIDGMAIMHTLMQSCKAKKNQDSPDSFGRLVLVYFTRVKTNAGTRAFSVAAPTLWNSLPDSVKSARNIASFRRNLKTYLFKMAYPP